MCKVATLEIDVTIFEVENLDFYYVKAKALHGINISFPRR